jgi:hypothetical protein
MLENANRNRPKRFGERTVASPEAREQMAVLIRAGMDPEEVAEKMVHGIKKTNCLSFHTRNGEALSKSISSEC